MRDVIRGLVVYAAMLPLGLAAWVGADGPVIYFEGEVQTSLTAQCGSCHTGANASAGLDVTNYKALLKSGAVVAGRPEASRLVQRLRGLGGKPQMPLGFQAMREQKVALIEKWIRDGAKSSGKPVLHWAYVPPKPPRVPAGSLWARNAIDAFVLESLKLQKLTPNPEAPRDVLARRLYLDLTGLPPSVEELDRYLADKKPDAYDRLVDHLLASRHYGEKMAVKWLDLARYADSDGYEKDLNRTAWLYRDWVVDAFNKNMPYSQFTIEQIAGDLLPQATSAQLVATGFNRNAMFNSEGGVDPAESHHMVLVDRVNTTSAVWLGSTMQCARCHDHKYDPFTQRDYYKFLAVFDNAEVERRGDYSKGQETWVEPTLPVPDPVQTRKLAELETKIKKSRDLLLAQSKGFEKDFDDWLGKLAKGDDWVAVETSLSTEAKQAFDRHADNSFLATGVPPDRDTYSIRVENIGPATGFRITVLPDESLPGRGPGRGATGNFILTRLLVNNDKGRVPLRNLGASFVQSGYDITGLKSGEPGRGWAVYGSIGKPAELVGVFDQPVHGPFTIKLEFNDPEWKQHVIGRLMVETTSVVSPIVRSPENLVALGKPSDKANRERLYRAFEKNNPSTAPTIDALEQFESELRTLKSQVPLAMVMKDKLGSPIQTKIHTRGEWRLPANVVTGGTPQVLGPKPSPGRFDRLSLAKWLVSADNPLTARVQVNRLWEGLFGRGLVETSEDFGTQGQKPSHPRLLDWLAIKFVTSGWNMKAMVRLMVTSSTYRQSSTASVVKLKKDPSNLWLS
ncbi:MAG: PSD1 domain-containing protein, partial [Chthonomonadaceae bacterium]|nr:PSD1 domain-containing protein [Chthonomonadaceae bacterium]